jgi:hypothetical protein
MEQRAVDCGTSPADAATRTVWHNVATALIFWPIGPFLHPVQALHYLRNK